MNSKLALCAETLDYKHHDRNLLIGAGTSIIWCLGARLSVFFVDFWPGHGLLPSVWTLFKHCQMLLDKNA